MLNSYSEPWVSSQTNVQEILASIPQEWDTFSFLDLEQGFFQGKICLALQALFAYETRYENYTYQRIPQRWSNNPGPFHTRIKGVLQGWPVRNYIDDLLIGGKGRKGHNTNLRKVLCRLEELGLKVNVGKARVGITKTVYLRYTICGSIYSLEDYIQGQMYFIPPIRNKKDLQKYWG